MKRTVDELVDALKLGENRHIRSYAAFELGERGTGTEGEAVLAALYQALGDPDELVAVFAATAFGKLGANAVPILIGALNDQRSDVRILAAFALMQIGQDASPAVEELRAAMNDPDRNVALQANFALSRILGSVSAT